jgi:hypothetical protein
MFSACTFIIGPSRQLCAQQHARAVQLRFRRPHRDREEFGDLLVPVALDVEEGEDLPRSFGEELDGPLQVEAELGVRRASGGVRHGDVVLPEPVAEAGIPGAPGEEEVDREAVQPGGEGGLPAEGAELLPGADEGILSGLVGLGGAEHPPGEGVDAGAVAAVEALEGGQIAGGGEAQVVPLGRGCSRRGS